MKPMIFQVEEPFEYLKKKGRVTSARSQPREVGEEVAYRLGTHGRQILEDNARKHDKN